MTVERQSHRMRCGEGRKGGEDSEMITPINLVIKLGAIISGAHMACSTKL